MERWAMKAGRMWGGYAAGEEYRPHPTAPYKHEREKEAVPALQGAKLLSCTPPAPHTSDSRGIMMPCLICTRLRSSQKTENCQEIVNCPFSSFWASSLKILLKTDAIYWLTCTRITKFCESNLGRSFSNISLRGGNVRRLRRLLFRIIPLTAKLLHTVWNVLISIWPRTD
jgi:hypothetical protein